MHLLCGEHQIEFIEFNRWSLHRQRKPTKRHNPIGIEKDIHQLKSGAETKCDLFDKNNRIFIHSCIDLDFTHSRMG